MRLRITKIHDAAKDRPDGYVEEVLSRGVIDGEWLEISDEDLSDLRAKFRPKPVIQPTPHSGIRGAGDLVALAAQPIARVIDTVFKTNIQHCGGCAKRRAALNAAIPFKD